MDEEQKEEEKVEESTASDGDADAGNQPQKLTAYEKVKQANAAAERLERAEKQAAERIRELTELQAELKLGGGITAGTSHTVKKEESPEEYVDKVLLNKV